MRTRPVTVEEICTKLRPVFGKKIDRLYLKYSLIDDPDKKEQIHQVLNLLYEKHLHTSLLTEAVLLEPPQEKEVTGIHVIGKISYADKDLYDFGLRDDDLVRHICVTGMSGSGKTMLAFNMLEGLIKKDVPFIVFDWKKSFRPLLVIDPNIVLFTVGNPSISNLFRININVPPKGMNPKEWVSMLCDLVTESFFASYGVNKILRETIDRAFSDFGVYKGSNNYPTWYQIRDRIEKLGQDNKRGRESEWIESALRIAYVLTYGDFGEAINSKEGTTFPIEYLLEKKVIFELQSLSQSEKKFFSEFVLSYIFFSKKADYTLSTKKLKNVILVDEAHNIFLKDVPNFMKETVTDMIYREIREYGIGLICLDQHISKLSQTVAGNSATNIAFQQMLPQDVETVSWIMQLRDEKNYFTMLPVGTAIVKLAERYFQPFLVKVPYNSLKEKRVTDEAIKNKMASLVKPLKMITKYQDPLRLKTEEEYEQVDKEKEEIAQKTAKLKNHLQEFLVGEIRQYVNSGMDKHSIKDYLAKQNYKSTDVNQALKVLEQRPENREKTTRFVEENKLAKRFLTLISSKNMPTTKIYKELEISAREGNELKQALLLQGLLEVIEQRNDKGWVKILKPTEKAKELL
jgi:uridine kinase